MRPRQRHFQNRAIGGDTAFITTTCLDHAPLFHRPEMREAMVAEIRSTCLHEQTKLHAFVVMNNHLHLLAELPKDRTVVDFVSSLKSVSSRRLFPKLLPEEHELLALQTGLGKRYFWQRSFRSVPVEGEEMFMQKVHYIHQNPIRAQICENLADYQWSSAKSWEDGLWNEATGLPLT